MFTTICSMFAGYNSFTEMEAFASAHKKEFEKYCPMLYGIPESTHFKNGVNIFQALKRLCTGHPFTLSEIMAFNSS